MKNEWSLGRLEDTLEYIGCNIKNRPTECLSDLLSAWRAWCDLKGLKEDDPFRGHMKRLLGPVEEWPSFYSPPHVQARRVKAYDFSETG